MCARTKDPNSNCWFGASSSMLLLARSEALSTWPPKPRPKPWTFSRRAPEFGHHRRRYSPNGETDFQPSLRAALRSCA